jgi:hypothetical protein
MIAPDLNSERAANSEIHELRPPWLAAYFIFCAGRSSTCLQPPPMPEAIASHCAWLVKPHSGPASYDRQ